MADENPDIEAARAALQERDTQLAQANARLQAMEETINALKPQAPQSQQAPAYTAQGKPIIPQHLRGQIAAQGLTDAEIEANGALILPFLNAYLGQAAGEVLALIQQQADEITYLKMLRDVESYPHADAVMGDMLKLRESEGKAGRYIDPGTAYKVAVANNLDRIAGQGSGESQFGGAPAASRAAAAPSSPATIRSRDLSQGSSLRSVRSPVTTPEKPATSAGDLMSMSREERRAFFEQNATTPIRSAG